MTISQHVSELLGRLDELGYDLVDRHDYDDCIVVMFKKPRGVNVGAVTVSSKGVVEGDHSPQPGRYYTPATVFDPVAGSGAFLTTIANPPFGTQEAPQ